MAVDRDAVLDCAMEAISEADLADLLTWITPTSLALASSAGPGPTYSELDVRRTFSDPRSKTRFSHEVLTASVLERIRRAWRPTAVFPPPEEDLTRANLAVLRRAWAFGSTPREQGVSRAILLAATVADSDRKAREILVAMDATARADALFDRRAHLPDEDAVIARRASEMLVGLTWGILAVGLQTRRTARAESAMGIAASFFALMLGSQAPRQLPSQHRSFGPSARRKEAVLDLALQAIEQADGGTFFTFLSPTRRQKWMPGASSSEIAEALTGDTRTTEARSALVDGLERRYLARIQELTQRSTGSSEVIADLLVPGLGTIPDAEAIARLSLLLILDFEVDLLSDRSLHSASDELERSGRIVKDHVGVEAFVLIQQVAAQAENWMARFLDPTERTERVLGSLSEAAREFLCVPKRL